MTLEECVSAGVADSVAESAEASTSSVVPTRPEGKKSSFGLPRLWRKIDISADVRLPPEKLEHSPSAGDGCPAELEKELRFLGCELCQSMAILLRLPQVAAATAQVLYQRYFYSKSLARNNYEHVAMACVALASKIEEAPRRIRDAINVFHFLKQSAKLRPLHPHKRPKPMVLGPEYVLLKNSVIKAERRVLKELGFCVHVRHPHKLLQAYLQALGAKELMSRAWGYMNDGLRTDIFVRHSAETIAAACIFLAARVEAKPLPLTPRPWWELFDVAAADLHSIAKVLLDLYARHKPLNWLRLDKEALRLLKDYRAKATAARVPAHSASATPSKGESQTAVAAKESRGGRESPPPKASKRSDHRNGSSKHSKSSSRGSENRKRNSSPPRGYGEDRAERKRRKRSRSRSVERERDREARHRQKEKEREVRKTLDKHRHSPQSLSQQRPLRPH